MKQDFTTDGPLLALLLPFRAVAEHGGFSAAARNLHVSPSAISQSIRQLEARLGQRLFNRTSRSVTLTENGHRFLAEASGGLDRISLAIADIRAGADVPSGLLRINLSRLAADICVLPCLDEFVRRFPEILLELFVDDLLTDVFAAGFDAGIRMGTALEGDMISVPVGPHLRRSVMASPEYLAAHGHPEHPRELVGHRAIRYRYPGSGRLEAWRFRDIDEDIVLEPAAALILTDNGHIAQATLQGLGIAQRFRETERDRLGSGELVSILDAFEPAADRFHLFYPSRYLMPPKLRVFIDHLRASTHSGKETDLNPEALGDRR